MEIGNVFFCECVSLLLLFSSSVVNSIVKSIVFTTDIFVLCKCLFSTYLLNHITIRIECEESVEILVTTIKSTLNGKIILKFQFCNGNGIKMRSNGNVRFEHEFIFR